jgi:Cupin
MDPAGHGAGASVLAGSGGVTMRLTSGSYRELHWHAANEWAYMLYGNPRVTVFEPNGNIFRHPHSEWQYYTGGSADDGICLGWASPHHRLQCERRRLRSRNCRALCPKYWK